MTEQMDPSEIPAAMSAEIIIEGAGALRGFAQPYLDLLPQHTSPREREGLARAAEEASAERV